MRQIQVAVIGGGLAGLTTAHLLKKRCSIFGNEAEIEVSLFETSSNLSNEHVPLSIADTEHEIISLVKELGIGLVPDSHKGYLPCSELMAVMVSEILLLKSEKLINQPKDWSTKQDQRLDSLDSMSIVHYFVEKGKNADEVRSLLQMSCLGNYADDFDNLSALDALRFLSQYLNCKLTYSIKGGYDGLLCALAESIDSDQQRVFFNKAVRDIESVGNKRRIVFADGRSQLFDYVVINKPNKQVYFKPGERRSMVQETQSKDDLLQVSRFASINAPASMNGAVRSAYRVVNHFLLPAIQSLLSNKDEALTPKVPMAVFTSGNDSTLEEETTT